MRNLFLRKNVTQALALIAPLGAVAALWGLHKLWEGRVAVGDDEDYADALTVIAGAWLVLGGAAWVWPRARAVARENAPLVVAALGGVALWEVLTAKLGVMPLPFFPGPEAVFRALVEDRWLLSEAMHHSLRLLALGFGAGSVAGFLTGVCFGWSRQVRYWGMPALKFFGPVPATAWIPLALVLFPTSFGASAFILALASFFPMVMLTSSGVAGVRHSHLEIARTLGATEWQLVRRVAIPSALPSIFTGLFIALSASFITLVVAEMIGVKAGLGQYVNWAQTWAEYHKVFAAILIMGVFFSGLMTLFFRLRDRILRWQQGLIKW